MTKQTNTAILIVAAGQSARLGRPKQNLVWRKKTLLQHSIDKALKSLAEHVYIVLGAYYDEIIKTLDLNVLQSHGVEIINNSNWPKGMASSIALGAQKAKSNDIDALLVMLCDQPLLTSAHLDELIRRQQTLNSQKLASQQITSQQALSQQQVSQPIQTIVATRYGESKKGVPAVFDSSNFDVLSQLSGDSGARALLNSSNQEVACIKPKEALFDIDSEEDYRRLLKLQ